MELKDTVNEMKNEIASAVEETICKLTHRSFEIMKSEKKKNEYGGKV